MRKPILMVALKAAVILYFAACANIEDYTVSKSATPVVTKGSWMVNLYIEASSNKTNDFAGYEFIFDSNGEIKATHNGITISGNWYEDYITRKVMISLGNTDPTLDRLNNAWRVTDVNNTAVSLQGDGNGGTETLSLTSL